MVNDTYAYAWRVSHDLGLACWVGGSIYDLVANQRAVKALPDRGERSVVVGRSWKALNAVTAAGVGAAAAGWAGARLTEARPDRLAGPEKPLSLAKDALTAASVGIAAVHGSQRAKFVRQAAANRAPVENGLKPAPETPSDVAQLQNRIRRVGNVKLAVGVSLLGVSSVMAQLAHSRPASRRALLRTTHPGEGRFSPLTGLALATGLAAAADEVHRRTGAEDRRGAIRSGLIPSRHGERR